MWVVRVKETTAERKRFVFFKVDSILFYIFLVYFVVCITLKMIIIFKKIDAFCSYAIVSKNIVLLL